MMAPDNPPVKAGGSKEENQNGNNNNNNRKGGGSTRGQDQQALKCPRCDSPNTKFCYYNNYSLTQPRHFCKTCRRYWTKGGALRNVPIGGGCRKNKKIKSSSSRLSAADLSTPSSTPDLGGFKFFHGLSPAMDFQLGGGLSSFPRLNPSPPPPGIYGHFPPFPDSASFAALDPCAAGTGSSAATSLMGFSNFPATSGVGVGVGGAIQEMGAMNVNSSLASSIESLSSINQDLHWKLQQQRLAMLFGGSGENQTNQKENSSSTVSVDHHHHHHHHNNQAQRPQPILFQSLELAASKPQVSSVGNNHNHNNTTKGATNETATEWFFGNSYAPVTPTPTSSGNGNDSTANWNTNGVQAWNDLHHQYTTLP